MNKKERSLTWKYFWQQKWKEVRVPLCITLVFIIFFFMLYLLAYAEKGNWQNIVLNIAGILFGLTFLIVTIICIYDWLQGNWKKAKKRAKKDLKKK